MAATDRYYIRAGVRRAVAAREAGWRDIPAIICELGRPDQQARIALDQLYSPKSEVLRDSRYIRNVEYPTATFGTQPPPIEVELIGTRGQNRSIPLAQVKLK